MTLAFVLFFNPRRLEFLLVNNEKTSRRSDLVEKIRSSFLDLLNLSSLIDIQVEVPTWQQRGVQENLKGVLLVSIVEVTNNPQISVD